VPSGLRAPRPAAARQPPQGCKKHLGLSAAAPSLPVQAWTARRPADSGGWRPGVFLECAPRPAAARQAPQGGKKHLGRPGVFLECCTN
jgi:hypothetical protein